MWEKKLRQSRSINKACDKTPYPGVYTRGLNARRENGNWGRKPKQSGLNSPLFHKRKARKSKPCEKSYGWKLKANEETFVLKSIRQSTTSTTITTKVVKKASWKARPNEVRVSTRLLREPRLLEKVSECAYFSSEAVWSSSEMFHATILQDYKEDRLRPLRSREEARWR